MPTADAPGWALRRVTPADVGSRVTLRRRLAGGGFSDTVGELLAWDGGELRVLRRTGEVAVVADTDVVASKVVPPAPVRRAGRQAAPVPEVPAPVPEVPAAVPEVPPAGTGRA